MWFFVQDYELLGKDEEGYANVAACRKIWPAELLDDPEAVRQSLMSRIFSADKLRVEVGALADAAENVCPECQETGCVVGCAGRLGPAVEGDVWVMSIGTLCERCAMISPFARAVWTQPTLSSGPVV